MQITRYSAKLRTSMLPKRKQQKQWNEFQCLSYWRLQHGAKSRRIELWSYRKYGTIAKVVKLLGIIRVSSLSRCKWDPFSISSILFSRTLCWFYLPRVWRKSTEWKQQLLDINIVQIPAEQQSKQRSLPRGRGVPLFRISQCYLPRSFWLGSSSIPD